MKTSGKYILDEHGEPVPCDDLLTWARWFESSANQRVVAQVTVDYVWISTVFLGLDHAFGSGEPILWETMVFTGPKGKRREQEMRRCGGSREQAEAMHSEMVAQFIPQEQPKDAK